MMRTSNVLAAIDLQARIPAVAQFMRKVKFVEAEHPRGDGGKFAPADENPGIKRKATTTKKKVKAKPKPTMPEMEGLVCGEDGLVCDSAGNPISQTNEQQAPPPSAGRTWAESGNGAYDVALLYSYLEGAASGNASAVDLVRAHARSVYPGIPDELAATKSAFLQSANLGLPGGTSGRMTPMSSAETQQAARQLVGYMQGSVKGEIQRTGAIIASAALFPLSAQVSAVAQFMRKVKFDEKEHPRGDGGKFAKSESSAPATTSAVSKLKTAVSAPAKGAAPLPPPKKLLPIPEGTSGVCVSNSPDGTLNLRVSPSPTAQAKFILANGDCGMGIAADAKRENGFVLVDYNGKKYWAKEKWLGIDQGGEEGIVEEEESYTDEVIEEPSDITTRVPMTAPPKTRAAALAACVANGYSQSMCNGLSGEDLLSAARSSTQKAAENVIDYRKMAADYDEMYAGCVAREGNTAYCRDLKKTGTGHLAKAKKFEDDALNAIAVGPRAGASTAPPTTKPPVKIASLSPEKRAVFEGMADELQELWDMACSTGANRTAKSGPCKDMKDNIATLRRGEVPTT